MAKKKKPEGQSQVEPTNAHGRRMPVTKTEAVKMAIAAGFDSPQIGAGYIQSQFGMDVSPQHFSSTKSQLKSRVLRGEAGPKPSARVAAKSQNGDTELIDALEAIKPLVASLGAERVKKLVDLLG